MKLFLAFLIALMQVTPTFAAQRILSADKIEGIVTQKEFIGSKGHFEKNAAGVSAYADAAGTSPVDGNGGSPNTTCTRSATSPISGDGSLIITKTSGASRQGEGCAMAFSTDTNHYGRVLTISADYIVSSGTFTAGSSSTDSDITVWLYDVTNAVIIQPSNYKFFSSSTTLSDKFIGQFQTASNSTSYRLIFHIGTTDTDAMTLKLDNISVSPQGTTLAPVITDWKSYVPTITTVSGTMTNYTASASYRRVGDDLEIDGSITFSAASSTFSSAIVALPSGLSIDTSKSVSDVIGTAAVLDDGVLWYRAVPLRSSTTTFSVDAVDTSSTYGSQAGITNTVPITFGSGDKIVFNVKVPILGWSSGLEIGDNYSGRLVAARATRATDQTGVNPNGSSVKINFDSVSAKGGFDTIGAYDTSAYRYNVKTSGKYSISGSVILAATNVLNNRYIVSIYKNGSFHSRGMEITPQASSYVTFPFAAISDAVSGDYFEVFLYGAGNNSASTLTIEASSSLNVSLLSSPAAIASGEKVAARYYSSQSTSMSTATTYALDFPTKDFDTHGAWTTTGGHNATIASGSKFTCPISGTYKASVFVMLNYTASDFNGTTEYFEISLYKNGAKVSTIDSQRQPSTQQYPSRSGVSYVSCNAGDYLQIVVYQDSGASQAMFVNNDNQWVVFEKL